jgi:NADPH:quinone reductase-like Zn-dependent oxidoreductase
MKRRDALGDAVFALILQFHETGRFFMNETQFRTREPRWSRLIRCAAMIATVAMAGTALGQQSDTIRQYRYETAENGYQLVLKEVPRPVAGANEVLVRVRAASLNRRDIYMLSNQYGPSGSVAGGIPLSDGAGEVIAVGDGVTRFKVGDRVAGIFFERWIDGPPSPDILMSARGGGPGGMLSEVIVTHEDGLVAIPDHLSFEEAATLPCAALTAWNGLFKRGGLQADQFVLLEGTGGVSMFGLIFAKAAGAKPIVTSSRDEKLERAKELGAHGTANYRTNPMWQKEVRALTGGKGVDQVLEVGGRETIGKALEALAFGGHVALIGGLSGFGGEIAVGSLMLINATASGIYVGSREDFEAMNAFISEHQIHPLIDRVFDFDEAPAAFEFMDSGSFMGKIVIRL